MDHTFINGSASLLKLEMDNCAVHLAFQYGSENPQHLQVIVEKCGKK